MTKTWRIARVYASRSDGEGRDTLSPQRGVFLSRENRGEAQKADCATGGRVNKPIEARVIAIAMQSTAMP